MCLALGFAEARKGEEGGLAVEPFTRAPAEDRRKYEKLTFSREDVSDEEEADSDEARTKDSDSIGSASDLRAMHEDEEELKDETVSETVTCSSSAYHAECESVNTQNEAPGHLPRPPPKLHNITEASGILSTYPSKYIKIYQRLAIF